ncbi:tetratricopeptide repeat-containing sensor histidine kinase [Tenacibaculum jejuense]|uniref:tetratricopeptide repeat-containing sensor histidine kinase n=1 Tax=Tenacibaculum jejuense TaxID=584609 RepID=UPI0012FDDBA9|nr:histidine kinase [Tenacibaculum jejuense]
MKKLFLLVIFLFSLNLTSQNKIFTQREINNYEITPNTPEQQNTYKKMLLSDKKLTGWLYYFRKKSHYHLTKKQYDSVLFYTRKASNIYHQDPLPAAEKKQMKNIYLYAGIALSKTQKYRKSTEYLFKTLEISKKNKKIHKASNIYIYVYLANNYLKLGDKKKALKYRLIVKNDSAYMASTSRASTSYTHLAILHEDLNANDSALFYYQKSLDISIKKEYDWGKLSSHSNLGDFYQKNDLIDSTIYHYTKSKDILDKYKNKPSPFRLLSECFTLSNYGYVLIHKGKNKKAIQLLNTVLDSIKNIKVDDEVKGLKFKTYDYLIKAYRNTDNLEKALDISQNKTKLFEEFHNELIGEKLDELNAIYEAKEKDASILDLTQKNIHHKTKIKQQNYLLALLILTLLALILIGVLIYKQRILKNKYETVNLEQRLLRSQLSPHFLFNSLNNLASLVLKKSDNSIPYINRLSSLLRLTIKNSKEEFVLLNDELKSIENYLELQSNFSKKFNYKIIVSEDIDQNNIYIPPMFIQPFVENSILHGFTNSASDFIEIKVLKEEKNKLLLFEIKDNGIGINNSTKDINHESLSGDILKQRIKIYSKSLNKKSGFSIISEENEGTLVNLSLPYIF